MKLFYYKSKQGNFGDDLNAWLWPELVPDVWNKREDTVFSGIGTVLNALLPESPNKVVFSSGVGYGLPPSLNEGSWDIFCVRGPMSAEVLGLDQSKAVTDGALLLRNLLDVVPESERSGTVFMPHVSAAVDGRWQEVCEKVGIEYLDPRADAKKTARRIASAKLVVADAMHAAIVADAMRVPWIPVITSVEIKTMKWLDWLGSLDLFYRPALLPQSSTLEWLKNSFYKKRGRGDALFLEASCEEGVLNLPKNASELALQHFQEKFQRYKRTDKQETGVKCSLRKAFATLKRLLRLFLSSKVGRALLWPLEKWHMRRAQKALEKALSLQPFLSEDSLCDAHLKKLNMLLKEFQKKYGK